MKHMWKDKKTPRPMILNEVLEGTFFDDGNREVTEGLLEDQKVWTLQECAQKFLSTALALRNSINEDSPPLSWDKDEDLHLDFVVAAANLRAGQFDIPRQSKWTVKSEAGNIIPAIATTNAVVGGMIVTEAIKVLAGKSSDLKQTFVYKQPQRKMYLLATEVDQKNPNCYVCSETYISLKVDTEKTSLRFFIDEILIKALNFTQPSVMVGDKYVM
jgi:ubiquitin-like 1-activating enzyme E1 B